MESKLQISEPEKATIREAVMAGDIGGAVLWVQKQYGLDQEDAIIAVDEIAAELSDGSKAPRQFDHYVFPPSQ